MMRVIALLLCMSSCAFAQLGPVLSDSGGSHTVPGWHPLKIGGGGFVTGIDLQSDGTKLARTNTGNAYRWDRVSSTWIPLLTTVSLPKAVWSNRQPLGVQEIVAAPIATSTFYLHFNGYLLKSTNSGASFSQLSGFPKDTDNSNGVGGLAGSGGPQIAVDPQNASIVFAGNNNTGVSGGLYFSTNGGTTFTQVSTGTIAQSSSFLLVAFDPSSSVVGGAKQGIYVCSYGTGCYHSTNGGSSWASIISGGPKNVFRLSVDAAGNVWAVDGSVWKYNGLSWTKVLGNRGYQSVATDPNNSTHIFAVTTQGQINVSLNTGDTWSGLSRGPTVTATDVPWLAVTAQQFLTIGHVEFDPSGSAPFVLYAGAGTGVFHVIPPTANVTSTTQNWISQTAGQETLVSNYVLAPPNGNPNIFSWDRSAFRSTDQDAYPTTQNGFPACAPCGGWAADWASSSPSTLFMVASQFGANDQSGISTDGGNSWTRFNTVPSIVLNGTNWGGCIAATSSTNALWLPGSNAANPYYTIDGGSSWIAITLPGVPATGTTGWGGNRTNAQCAADRVIANTYYLYNTASGTAGFYTCSSAGASCSRTIAGLITLDSGITQIKAVPGHAGHVFLTPVFDAVKRTTNGGASWSTVMDGSRTFTQVTAMGFGAVFPGKSYPSIYLVGMNGSIYGVWRSIDNGMIWANLGYPLNTFIQVSSIDGDKQIPQRVYLTTSGHGSIYGYFNFLLKRDLGPALNDNDPVWLEKAA